MKKKILFVDDDPNVLQGLRRMLRPMHHEWDVEFVQSAHEALEFLSRDGYDVVVSDMRMPGMDGAQLLGEVREKYPQVVRIVLSGHSSQEAILRSVGPAHQYLTKPCDPEILKSTISRACNMREVLTNYKLRELVSQLKTLPSLPDLYIELVKELQSENVSLKRAGDIVARDIGMTAKILQLVNSAFFGLPRHIGTPAEAVSLLGTDTVKALVLSMHVFAKFEQEKIRNFSIEKLMAHSISTGEVIRAIVQEEKFDRILKEHAILAGFLHDAGQLVLAANLPKKYALISEFMKENQLSLQETEFECLGATHAEVGASLLGLWGLPTPIVEAVAFHHSPSSCVDRKISPLTLVHVADAFVNEFQKARGEGETTCGLDNVYLAELGLIDKIPPWRAISQKVLKNGKPDE